MNLGTVIVICLVFGGITAAIAQAKNLRPLWQWFLIGAVLGIIGVVIVIFTKSGLPQAPPGMRAVKCRTCNTVQNIPETQPVYECWQCKATHRLWEQPEPELAQPRVDDDERPGSRGTKPAALAGKDRVRCHKCQHVQTVSAELSTFVCEECGARLKRRAASA